MTLDYIKENIHDFVSATFQISDTGADIALDYPLMSSVVIDSVSMLMLINHLEETFGISFDVHEIDRNAFNTIDQMAEQVYKKQQNTE